jgi:hypothetical protein
MSNHIEAIASVIEYAERYADLNDEPQSGGCSEAIKAAHAARAAISALFAKAEEIVSRAGTEDPTDREYDDIEGAEAYGGDVTLWEIAEELRPLVQQLKGNR